MGHRRAARVEAHVAELCAGDHRHVGSSGNRTANAMFERVAAGLGYRTRRLAFECIDWQPGPARLEVGPERFDLVTGPYSPACELTGKLAVASSREGIAAAGARGAVLLLVGAVARKQLVPRGYPFYSEPDDEAVLAAIEEAGPAAVVAATGKDPGLTGAVCPFPLIEDGSFALPSAAMLDVDGERLAAHAGREVALTIASRRRPARADQVVARKAGFLPSPRRILLAAHIDTKVGTPGAVDNAAGVACVLAAAERLEGVPLRHTLELVPFNGEDHYAAPGEVAYLAANASGLDDVLLAINVDAAGLRGGATEVSTYGCSEAHSQAVTRCLGRGRRVVAGRPWPQSDHMVFAMRGVPAVALTTERFEWLTSEVAHTPLDDPSLVDAELLMEAADFLTDLILTLDAG